MCILLINSTRSSVLEIVFVLTILVDSFFFRDVVFHISCLCIGLKFPLYIDEVLYFHILFLLEYLVSAESRRQFKPVLEGMRAAALSI